MPDTKRNSRLSKLRRKYGNIDESAWVAAVHADPSPTRKYVSWIIERCSGEDFPAVRNALAKYDALKPRLPAEKRNILQYASLKALQDVLGEFASVTSQKTGRQRKRDIIQQARRESIHLTGEDITRYLGKHIPIHPGMTVDIPLTVDANKILGRNTKWCTAAETNNAMYSYSRGFIVIFGFQMEGGRHKRFQAYLSRNSSGPLQIFPETNAWDDESCKEVAPYKETICRVMASLNPEKQECDIRTAFEETTHLHERLHEVQNFQNYFPIIRSTLHDFLEKTSRILEMLNTENPTAEQSQAYHNYRQNVFPEILQFNFKEILQIAEFCRDKRTDPSFSAAYDNYVGVFINEMSAHIVNVAEMANEDYTRIFVALGYGAIIEGNSDNVVLDDIRNVLAIGCTLREIISSSQDNRACVFIHETVRNNLENIGRHIYGNGHEKYHCDYMRAVAVAYLAEMRLFQIFTVRPPAPGNLIALHLYPCAFYNSISLNHIVSSMEMAMEQDPVLYNSMSMIFSSSIMRNRTFSIKEIETISTPWIRELLQKSRKYEGYITLYMMKNLIEWSLNHTGGSIRNLFMTKLPVLLEKLLEIYGMSTVSISDEMSLTDIQTHLSHFFMAKNQDNPYQDNDVRLKMRKLIAPNILSLREEEKILEGLFKLILWENRLSDVSMCSYIQVSKEKTTFVNYID